MTTGKHSLLNLVHGYIRCLHEQAKSDWSFDEIKELMKTMSIENGWPCKSLMRKKDKQERYYKIPRSISGRTDDELKIIAKTIEVFADENSFWLTYYDELEKPYRSLGGRTKSEMEKYIAGLRDEGRVAEAQELEKAVEVKE